MVHYLPFICFFACYIDFIWKEKNIYNFERAKLSFRSMKMSSWKNNLLRNGFIFSSWLFLCVFNLVKGCENMIIWCSNYSVFKKLVINSHCIKSEKLVCSLGFFFKKFLVVRDRQRERCSRSRQLPHLLTNFPHYKYILC